MLHNNTLNEILVFDMSLATGLYALTIYAGTVMGTWRRGISRILRDVSDCAACVGLDWNAYSYIREARFAHWPCTQCAGVQWAMGPDPCAIGFRPTAKLIYSDSRVPRKKDYPELYLDLMTTRTRYLIKHTLPSARYNRWSLSHRATRGGSSFRIMLCDVTW